MVPLPDSIVDTTLFVGNLCEFVKDDDLSNLFQTVSKLSYLPACVARKVSYESLEYGFVTFPSVEEKENALIRFHGYELMGRPLRLECIRDRPNFKRVRVPERLVNYLCGEAKKTRDGKVNTLRRARGNEVDTTRKAPKKKKTKKAGQDMQKSSKLSEVDSREMERAVKKGYVTLASTGFRRGRRASPLANAHREWCDTREKPQIVVCKATGGRPLDNVIVDLSPLRIHGIFEDAGVFDDLMIQWKAEILDEAHKAGMELRGDYIEDNTIEITDDDPSEDEDCQAEFEINIDSEKLASMPIWKLPCVSIGVFEGQRSQAKAMANSLAQLWGIPEEQSVETIVRERRPKNKDCKAKPKHNDGAVPKNIGKSRR